MPEITIGNRANAPNDCLRCPGTAATGIQSRTNSCPEVRARRSRRIPRALGSRAPPERTSHTFRRTAVPRRALLHRNPAASRRKADQSDLDGISDNGALLFLFYSGPVRGLEFPA